MRRDEPRAIEPGQREPSLPHRSTAWGALAQGPGVPEHASQNLREQPRPKCRYLGFVAGQTGDLGFCVEDMSSTECSAVEALGAEGSCELFSEGGVVGA